MDERSNVVKHSTMPFPIHRRMFRWPSSLLPILLFLGCGGPAPLTVDMPLHLEDHLDVATIVGSESVCRRGESCEGERAHAPVDG